MVATESKDIGAEIDLTQLTEDAKEILFDGAPETFSDPGPETVPVETVLVPETVEPEKLDGKVVLTNIYFERENILIPEGNKWSGRKIVFENFRAIVDRETADVVLAIAPHIYEELPNAHWFTHEDSNFRTTSAHGFQEFTKLWAANNR